MRYIHCLIVYFLLFIKPIFSQEVDTLTAHYQYYAECYEIEDGLPDVNVNDIYQDKQGFLWLATNNGLSRFDGKKFKNFVYFT